MWIQKQLYLRARARGFHLVTDEILQQLPELREVKVGIMNIFIQHTSASLTLNENADPAVRQDFEDFFNHIVPEDAPYYRHMDEGSDDLPAHLKSSLLGCSLIIPVTNGRPNLGTWQGIYLCEHRNHGGSRRLVITINGE
ncbi:secondary thiamine-phosphate synthase enzyme YjbQ [Nitrosomonas sp. Is37]|uniref:secondary thiamine-phosphate synthase enzyme YjbQ n=1 Tax=Nitrosomonas sp. Is37 TaxID=3080535 RepID=UPI00294AB519|nr:secondary thiamine-phosphate synthase enzyme YjbQ [Nitrosomonas sp. Is37]MDV6344263.1 secondary thiamine-phosphate synthase enzyme YjbQ [Nitrosomonas sp. Is37]